MTHPSWHARLDVGRLLRSLHGGRKMTTTKQAGVALSAKELRIMVQSLGNCLETCQVHAEKPSAHCADCDAARKLKLKLEKHLAA